MDRKNLTEHEINSYSPLTLAFLGDSVYETLVREYLLRKANMPVSKLHAMKVKLVCAEFQSAAFDSVAGKLSENELAILRRGRNAKGISVPKHAETAEYRKATAIEALFGYLYLAGKSERMYELFDVMIKNSDDSDIAV